MPSPGGLAWEESISKFTQVVGRIYFLVSAGLKALASCWLSAGGHLLLREAIRSSQRLLQYLETTHVFFWSHGLSQYGLLIHQAIQESESASLLESYLR